MTNMPHKDPYRHLRIMPLLRCGSDQNSIGKFAKAEAGSITAAAAVTATEMPKDFRVSITNSKDED